MTTDPKTIDNIGRSPQEQAAIAQVLRLGHEFGFGNLMHCLDREWAKMLKEKWSIGDGEHHWLGGNLSDSSRVHMAKSVIEANKAVIDELIAKREEAEHKLAIAVEGLEKIEQEHNGQAAAWDGEEGDSGNVRYHERLALFARSTIDKITTPCG